MSANLNSSHFQGTGRKVPRHPWCHNCTTFYKLRYMIAVYPFFIVWKCIYTFPYGPGDRKGYVGLDRR